MIKYRVCYGQIKAMEVLRETKSSVFLPSQSWVNGTRVERREAKSSSVSAWFDSWEEAKQYTVDRAKREIESAEWSLARKKKELERVMALSEEECHGLLPGSDSAA